MNKNSLSIIIPVYNVEKYLEECLNSIFCQYDPERMEIICLNDGSTDKSIEVLNKFARQFDELIVLEHYNIGLGATRNKGILTASGKYILFIDSDDWIIDDSITRLLKILENREDDIIEFKTHVFKESYKQYKEFNTFDQIISNGIPGEQYLEMQNKLLLTAWSKLWKREFLLNNNLRFAENVLFEDVRFSLPAYFNATKISNIDLAVYCYRLREGSITKSKVNSKFLEDFYNERLFTILKTRRKTKSKHVRTLMNKEIARILIKSFTFVRKTETINAALLKYVSISIWHSIVLFPVLFRIVLSSVKSDS